MAIQLIGNGGVIAEVDANTRALLTRPQPIDIGALGSYRGAWQTGTVTAGAAPLSPWFSFRWGTPAASCILRHVRVGLQAVTAFTAGNALIDVVIARAFTVSDSGGTVVTPVGDSQKKKTNMASTLVTDMRIASTVSLTPGARTLDAAPAGSTNFTATTTPNSVLLTKNEPSRLFNLTIGDGMWPFVFVQNEGFILRATVPANGTWIAFVDVDWDEKTTFP